MGGVAIRGEEDRPAVGRPGRAHVARRIVGEPALLSRLDVEQPDLGIAGPVRHVGDLPAVGGEPGAEVVVGVESEAPLARAVDGVEVEVGLVREGRDREAPVARRHRGVDQRRAQRDRRDPSAAEVDRPDVALAAGAIRDEDHGLATGRKERFRSVRLLVHQGARLGGVEIEQPEARLTVDRRAREDDPAAVGSERGLGKALPLDRGQELLLLPPFEVDTPERGAPLLPGAGEEQPAAVGRPGLLAERDQGIGLGFALRQVDQLLRRTAERRDEEDPGPSLLERGEGDPLAVRRPARRSLVVRRLVERDRCAARRREDEEVHRALGGVGVGEERPVGRPASRRLDAGEAGQRREADLVPGRPASRCRHLAQCQERRREYRQRGDRPGEETNDRPSARGHLVRRFSQRST